MANTYSWLCQYAIAQIGRPYWFNTEGEIATPELYQKIVLPALQANSYTPYGNERDAQMGQKVHDCSGLITGALLCDGYDTPPTPGRSIGLAHRATLQFTEGCNSKGTMTTFPKIPGALVFKTNGSLKQHVGIYVGKYIGLNGDSYEQAVVDARNHNKGVVVGELNTYAWDSWGMLKSDICRKDTNQNTIFDASTFLSTPSNVTVVSKQLEVDPSKMTPFIATVLAGYNPTIDYQKIIDARISGMMFFGGQLFNASHQRQTYIYGYLDNQVKQCNNAGLPYALYVNVRAQSVIEADEECRALYYLISRYPPKLGLWLALETGATIKSINDSILEVYYKYIYKWGLGAKCGLYVTQKQLNTITWDSFKDRFYLWLISSMPASEVDDELLTPEMFEVPD